MEKERRGKRKEKREVQWIEDEMKVRGMRR